MTTAEAGQNPPGGADAPPPEGGEGPADEGTPVQRHYHHPAAGWGAAKSVTHVLAKERAFVDGPRAIFKMNHENGGFDCPGCAWPDDTKGLKLDICENGIKHVTWEMTPKRAGRELFARHSVSELATWTDFALEDTGRLTEPMVYNPETDHYEPITWKAAFELVGRELRALDDPNEASFYTSGRLGNEATFLYQLWAREFGTNNLPDCSNMCHEASGRALTAALGTGKGTADLADWESADALFIMGVNAASNAPRMLTALAEAYDRGAQIVHVNPLVEAAATRTIVPHDFLDMALFKPTRTSTLNLQVRAGGDMALLRGMAKAVLEESATDPNALDRVFIDRHTHGFEEYRALCEATPWEELERQSGLSRQDILKAAQVYSRADRTLISWCLGVSQHEHGVDTVREIVNVLLLRGNLGREGAGPSPVRGHSNVQGNRTCGIDHRPAPEFLDMLAEACGIDPPREHGLDTVGTIAAMHEGKVKVFVGMGGNFVMAAPDTPYTAEGMRKCELTVQVSTKLNRSHVVHGRKALILPCLGRTEKDHQRRGIQSTSVEDSMSMVHLSVGMKRPASPHLLSEPAIIAGMARATLPDSATPWEKYVEDYDRIRDTMSVALDGFEDFNRRVRLPLGFRIKQPARELIFFTPSQRAEFSTAPLPDVVPGDEEVLILQTMRSHDQWNTTIYSDDDRYRGIKNLRTLILMNAADMRARGISPGSLVDIAATSKDGSIRTLNEYRALAYDMPRGCAAGYMPEMNVLIGKADYSTQSDQPLMKNVRVKVTPSGVPARPMVLPAS
ncbi:FdhF/YdeP family oxidoreductase [Streptomyces albidoflavus]|uniref:FdhF/YdeP family oxidoreductase n=1 Tax=Streptomyces TaxID=1883 RepID=UPI00024936E1|nr:MULTISPECIES: FdhF/YdeP family oxidoreductase [Streptomyces]MCM3820139.1 FdhF/YdeP family oxidoreductase [Streptomyces sp. DR3-1]QHC19341.1 FdhF/YdeP family oxidoreductase [Streptomyces sp. GF20]RZD68699.1 formate dehydrogenase [Streptomyces albidoflavus]RZD69812.1 formate dehydrogenase [Streptomyces albidoflavus]RZD86018.1 formate dehydrogenase [Streptomyces albidoflavus]